MARSKKLGFSEVNDLEQLSTDALKQRFYALAQSAEKRKLQSGSNLPSTAAARRDTTAPSLAELDLGAPQSDRDIANMSVNDLAEQYLDPATLEARPDYADGSAPEKAIMKSPSGSMWERTKLAFTNKPLEEQVKMLEEEYGSGNVKLSKGKNLTVKQNGAWYQLDPQGGGSGDFFDKAMERTQDVLADNADIALGLGAGLATAGLAAPALAGLSGAGLLAAQGGVALAGGANSAMSKILMGRLAGTYEATPEEMIKDIGVESLLSLGGEMFIPGVKYGARELGAKFMKAAPALEAAADGVKTAMAKTIGYTSGVGEEVADQWINNAKKVGQQIAQYGKDEQGALIANIGQTKDIARGVVEARNAFGRDIYTGFAKEAGEDFAPWIGKVFTSSNVADEIGLIKDGVLKWDGKNGKLLLNSVDDIISANPTTGHIFQNNDSRKALQMVLNEVNDFNKLRPATGEMGARQFLAFKERIGNAVNKAVTIADEAGDTQAIRYLKDFQAQVKTSYLQKAVDAVKAPEMAAKLAKVDKSYADMKAIIRPFEDAVKKNSDDAYRMLYDKTFGGVNISSRKAVAKNQLQKTVDMLGVYKPQLADWADDIGARKAALASTPWFRKGLVGQAAALGSVTTLNPAVIAGAAMTSPKLNFEAAKMASSLYNGLDFIRKMSPETKKQFLATPEAVAKFYKTTLSMPGLESQIAAQLGSQVTNSGGQSNGQ